MFLFCLRFTRSSLSISMTVATFCPVSVCFTHTIVYNISPKAHECSTTNQLIFMSLLLSFFLALFLFILMLIFFVSIPNSNLFHYQQFFFLSFCVYLCLCFTEIFRITLSPLCSPNCFKFYIYCFRLSQNQLWNPLWKQLWSTSLCYSLSSILNSLFLVQFSFSYLLVRHPLALVAVV